jgi:DNA repair exonuclease SbcCD ATPase subunit
MFTVKLVNFRCHREKSFEFATGLNLIDGSSGKGKTTILEAIHFCLIGKHRNVVTRGEKKCSVTLSFNGITIQRTKSPNRLTIQPIGLEDDAAQEYIFQLIGGEDFELTSYMLQKGTSQFFTLSSSEKRKFVESLSKRNTQTIEKMKEKIYNDLKAKKLKLVEYETRLNMLLKQPVILPEKPCDLGIQSLEDLKWLNQFVSTIQGKQKEELTSVDRCLSECAQKMKAQARQNEQRNHMTTQLTLLRQQHEEQTKQLESLGFEASLLEQTTQTIDLHDCYLLYQKRTEELQEKKKTYEQLVQQEDTEHKKQLALLESKLKPQPEIGLEDQKQDVERLEIQQKNIKKKLELLDKKAKLSFRSDLHEEKKAKLTKYQSWLEQFEQRKNIQKCPHCDGSVILVQQSVHKADHAPILPEEVEKAKQIRKAIPQLKSEIDEGYRSSVLLEQIEKEIDPLVDETQASVIEEDYKVAKKKLDDHRAIVLENKMIEAQLSIQKAYVPKDKYAVLRKQFEQGVETRKAMKKGEFCEDIYQMRKIQQDQKEKKIKWEQLNRSIADTTAKIESVQKTLSGLVEADIVDYTSELERLEGKRTALQPSLEELSDTVQKIELYRLYGLKKMEQRKREAEMEQVRSTIALIQQDLLTLETFSKKITEAENRCVEEMIDLINQKVKVYLDRFFQTDPMVMRLMTEKEDKKGSVKSELNIQLTYKDAICDLTSLSGGEYDRCSLAFMLAINELSSSPFLILDESISSLDMGNAENVLDVLKDSQPDKFVLLISHQANTGMFDHVLSV